MGEESVPEVKREVDVSGGEKRDEVIFEGTDSAFRGIRAVILRGNELD